MTLARTFPIHLAPLPGEALDSWLEALAHRLDARLGDVLGDLGLAAPVKNGIRELAVPTDWTIALREEEAARIARATGADPQQLHDMTLMRFDGRALRIDQDKRKVSLALPVGKASWIAVLPGMPGRQRRPVAVDLAPGLVLRLPDPPQAARRPLSGLRTRPARAALDVLAVQLGQAADVRVGGGQVLAEHDQAVGAQADGVRPQRGRHRGQVAQRGRADAGLADRLHPLGDARLAGPGLPRRILADPRLIAGLVQAEDASGVMHPGMTARRGRLGQGLGEGREIVIAQLGEGLGRGQADQGQRAAGHIAGPVRAPPEPLRHRGDLLHVAGMPGGPLQVKVTGSLGQQQIKVGGEMAFDETPGQERPRAGALQVRQRAGVGRLIHAASCGWAASSRPAALRRSRRPSWTQP